jgi:hypothetical protein
MTRRRDDDSGPLADRRNETDPPPTDEPDFADEHTPSATDPSEAAADAPGGEDEGYRPQTQV